MCRGNFPVTIIPIYTAGQFRCVLDHFNNLRIVSGNTCNLVTAHKPAPISFTLAPKCNSLILRCFCSRNLRPQSIPFPFSELEQKIRDDLCSHGVCPAVSSILANWREQESKKWMFKSYMFMLRIEIAFAQQIPNKFGLYSLLPLHQIIDNVLNVRC